MSEKPFWRRRRVRLTAVGAAVAVVVAGGTFWLSDGYGAWGDDRALDTACDGDLAADEVRALYPGVEFTASSELQQTGWQCSVAAGSTEKDANAALSVRIRSADEPFVEGDWIDPGSRAAPLGNGWTGSFAYDADDPEATGRARVTLLLDCGTQPGDGLLASVAAELPRSRGYGDPAARDRLTAVLTGTAMSYAKRTGCAATAGKPVKNVGVSATARDHKPLAKASGTCAGVVDAATAGRWGAGTVIETAAAPAPVEQCTLGSKLGAPLYEFTASYGPYGEKALTSASEDIRKATGAGDSPTGHYRLTAQCPGAADTAVYDVQPDKGLALDHASLRTALKAFADRSATRHGCEKPA